MYLLIANRDYNAVMTLHQTPDAVIKCLNDYEFTDVPDVDSILTLLEPWQGEGWSVFNFTYEMQCLNYKLGDRGDAAHKAGELHASSRNNHKFLLEHFCNRVFGDITAFETLDAEFHIGY